jgi:ferredoxin
MPKMMDPVRCQKCGSCALGCAHAAKWTALEYLAEATQNGTQVRYDTRVERVLVDGGKAQGV